MSRLNLLSGGAAQGLVGSLAPAFTAQTGLELSGEFGAVGAMAEKLRRGAPADMVILTAGLVAELAEQELVVPTSVADVGRVETALAVRTGTPLITVYSVADLRESLLAADAIFVPDIKASTAGIHVARVLNRLGIIDAVAARLRVFPNGATAMRELAKTDARRAIGCTQSTEIIAIDGVAWSCPLPKGYGLATMYTAAITTTAAHAAQARELIDLLVDDKQYQTRKRAGFLTDQD
jgi:molybdate transport system substrate-binding protein